MVWDSGFASWEAYDVTGQPFFVLVDADGTELGRWGQFSDEIQDLIS